MVSRNEPVGVIKTAMIEINKNIDPGTHRTNSYFRYWGKADPNYPGESKWHPLAYHCLDIASVDSQRRLMAARDG